MSNLRNRTRRNNRNHRGGGCSKPAGTVFSNTKAAMASGCPWSHVDGKIVVVANVKPNNNGYSRRNHRGGGCSKPAGTVFSNAKSATASGCPWSYVDGKIVVVANVKPNNNGYSRRTRNNRRSRNNRR